MNTRLFVNGIDGVTGQYAVPPMELRDVATLIKGGLDDSAKVSWLRRVWRTVTQPHLGLPLDVKPEEVESSGWGIVFHHDEDDAVKKALAPLIAHRRKQINNDAKVKELEYRTKETRASWLARHGVGAGNVEPTKVPYYLLMVGAPSRIPFGFVHEVDVEYCVGFLHFDTAEEYEQYAQSVIAYEQADRIPNRKEVVFFAPRHAFDAATQMSADLLVKPLADGTPAQGSTPAAAGTAERWGFGTRKIVGDSATKEALISAMKGVDGMPPAFLFTASHGMVWPKGHEKQTAAQGALLCQDWPGFGSIKSNHYLTAADVPADAQLHGAIVFHFACYGAGTPEKDRFTHAPGRQPPSIAEQPFISALPRALLTHQKGGALCCIGHVERAWGYSIVTEDAGPQLIPFQNAIGRILVGQPAGYAMKDFNEKYAALSTSLASMLEQVSFGATVSDQELATVWTERNDAEGYLLLGDPAVRLRTAEMT